MQLGVVRRPRARTLTRTAGASHSHAGAPYAHAGAPVNECAGHLDEPLALTSFRTLSRHTLDNVRKPWDGRAVTPYC